MPNLSTRLKAIFEQLISEKPVWDFCCDHGFLGNAAIEANFPEVHFVDKVPHILQQLKMKNQKIQNKVQVHYHISAGEMIRESVEGNVIIAGVGPAVISRILDGLIDSNNLQATRLILGPQRDPEKLEEWILSKSWPYALSSVLTVKERGRERKLFIVKRLN